MQIEKIIGNIKYVNGDLLACPLQPERKARLYQGSSIAITIVPYFAE